MLAFINEAADLLPRVPLLSAMRVQMFSSFVYIN
jgi:hypothetical protein